MLQLHSFSCLDTLAEACVVAPPYLTLPFPPLPSPPLHPPPSLASTQRMYLCHLLLVMAHVVARSTHSFCTCIFCIYLRCFLQILLLIPVAPSYLTLVPISIPSPSLLHPLSSPPLLYPPLPSPAIPSPPHPFPCHPLPSSIPSPPLPSPPLASPIADIGGNILPSLCRCVLGSEATYGTAKSDGKGAGCGENVKRTSQRC